MCHMIRKKAIILYFHKVHIALQHRAAAKSAVREKSVYIQGGADIPVKGHTDIPLL